MHPKSGRLIGIGLILISALRITYNSMGFHRSTLLTEIEHTYGDGDTCEPVTHPDLRPELLHITKTGGTTLEIVGAMYNFTWGACHWLNSVDDMGSLRCPQINITKPPSLFEYGVPIWHVPPK